MACTVQIVRDFMAQIDSQDFHRPDNEILLVDEIHVTFHSFCYLWYHCMSVRFIKRTWGLNSLWLTNSACRVITKPFG